MTSLWLRRFTTMSLRDYMEALANPRLVAAKVHTPAPLSPVRAITQLYPQISAEQASEYRLEFLRNGAFFEEISQSMVDRRRRRPRWICWLEFVYVAVRSLRPGVMVETGVFDGKSSAVILQAMEANQHGALISIDLPADKSMSASTDQMADSSLPPGLDPGWIVPERLRGRWQLRLGDSRKLLPAVFEEHPQIDIFFHDSLHTFEHMYFEYTLAWPHIREGGLLLSDDILWNHAFTRFCREQGKQFVNLSERNHHYWMRWTEGFGAVRK